MEVCRGVCKLMQASTEISRGDCNWWKHWKVPLPPTGEILCISMDANFHGSKSVSTKSMSISMEVKLLPPTSMEFCTEVNLLPSLSWKRLWK